MSHSGEDFEMWEEECAIIQVRSKGLYGWQCRNCARVEQTPYLYAGRAGIDYLNHNCPGSHT